jgi:hypothetical protein
VLCEFPLVDPLLGTVYEYHNMATTMARTGQRGRASEGIGAMQSR